MGAFTAARKSRCAQEAPHHLRPLPFRILGPSWLAPAPNSWPWSRIVGPRRFCAPGAVAPKSCCAHVAAPKSRCAQESLRARVPPPPPASPVPNTWPGPNSWLATSGLGPSAAPRASRLQRHGVHFSTLLFRAFLATPSPKRGQLPEPKREFPPTPNSWLAT